MRIVSLGERVEKELYLLVVILLVDIAGQPIVAALDQFRSRLDWVLAQIFLEQLVPIRPRQRSSASASSFGQGAFCR